MDSAVICQTSHELIADAVYVKHAVKEALARLLEQDRCLFDNDVSERAITHKLAEYLQGIFPNLNVDCEYNRNAEMGPANPKELLLDAENVKSRARANKQQFQTNDLEEEINSSVSTYPDIIVHRRLTNNENLLVVEVKKQNSQIDHDLDHAKLKAFTCSATNQYRYKHGVFILLHVGSGNRKPPELIWYKDGVRED